MRRYWRGGYSSYGSFEWGLFFALGLIAVGVYYMFRNAGVLPWLPEDVFWPILLIGWGVALLLRIGTRRQGT